ncbi:nucleotide exchange factor GrpE [Alloalcanivorax xenomutans]|uniref:nucleotide exchange factor GrpE n=1 Tax=Alloalcanivorax xenomutans TaxID=1094342 RepID=UPI003D9B1AC6
MSDQDKQKPQDEAVTQDSELENPQPAAEVADEEAAAEPDAARQLAEAQEQMQRLEKALAEADLRAQAEIQNVRRRAEREVENAHKFALEKFAGDLLSVADSLERGLSTLDAEDEALKPAREGLELTLKVLMDAFGRHNLEQVDPHGEPFNPERHEAMTMISAPGAEPNTVIDVLEKGYLLNGRLIRPARVVVSKAEG